MSRPKRVLVACEFSGIVRDAFLAEGHDAISCDLLPTESPGPHIQGDVTPLLQESWDIVIAHPPCSYLCRVQASFKNWEKPGHEDFWCRVDEAIAFFLDCLNANAPRVAVENPVPAKWARDKIGSPDDYIEPYYFGDLYRKKTGLWLRGLPPLMRGCRVVNPRPWVGYRLTKKITGENAVVLAGGATKTAKDRARFWPGIAQAMAKQWGTL